MTKSEWLWVARYLLIIGGSFLAGYSVRGRLHPLPTYAVAPDDCKYANMKATGWTVREEYKGGINNGGITSFLKHECK